MYDKHRSFISDRILMKFMYFKQNTQQNSFYELSTSVSTKQGCTLLLRNGKITLKTDYPLYENKLK